MKGIHTDSMDPLDFLSQEELKKFFHCKKTEISCMNEPHTFLNQLRDHDLVPEDLYKKVINMRSKERRKKGVYDILEWVEQKKGQRVKKFWWCVFQEHILQNYPVFRFLRNSLLDGSYKSYLTLPDTEDESDDETEPVQKEEEKVKGRKGSRKRKKSDEGTEEEEEEPGPSSFSTPSKKKAARKPTFCSPLKRGQKAEIWTWDLYKTTLPVTCGNKDATLHRDKLARGLKSILYEAKWFTPNEFEKLAGKGSSKNWKLSIRCQKTPLQKLIAEGHLQCPRMKRRCVRKSQRELFPSSSSESSSSPVSFSSLVSLRMDESSEDQEEEGEEDRERGADQAAEEEEDEDDGEDLTEFQAAVLPVSCGSITGELYKNRFTGGSRSKSIRTEERWFTPEDFVKQELTLTDRHWKKDILCHGKTLDYLVKKVLHIHSVSCKCDCCDPTDPLAQNNDDVCFICDSDGDDDGELVCCDECPRAFHKDCHLPPYHNDSNGDKWMCTFCIWKINQRMWRDMSLEQALKSPINQNIMRCEYLLLCLYKEDVSRVFTKEPLTTVSGYSSVRSNPIWLDKVKDKLQRKLYTTVGEFVDDIRLVFQNWQTFNRDEDVSMLGTRLSELFEQKFHTCFKIQ
ncbi:nuclear body protein SP140-like protein isoform X2 [Tachysurus fulvidraco]|uniref:nuclear body protein SP140-like protein isoform X2 n=1 Tax=Tachysurus fulvidraco TaxID=1234273 RepID=UPI001FEEFEEE|nr:nuclear body protein SP140-like protein isoform X2 [Tachysurus fulvidraco]